MTTKNRASAIVVGCLLCALLLVAPLHASCWKCVTVYNHGGYYTACDPNYSNGSADCIPDDWGQGCLMIGVCGA